MSDDVNKSNLEKVDIDDFFGDDAVRPSSLDEFDAQFASASKTASESAPASPELNLALESTPTLEGASELVPSPELEVATPQNENAAPLAIPPESECASEIELESESAPLPSPEEDAEPTRELAPEPDATPEIELNVSPASTPLPETKAEPAREPNTAPAFVLSQEERDELLEIEPELIAAPEIELVSKSAPLPNQEKLAASASESHAAPASLDSLARDNIEAPAGYLTIPPLPRRKIEVNDATLDQRSPAAEPSLSSLDDEDYEDDQDYESRNAFASKLLGRLAFVGFVLFLIIASVRKVDGSCIISTLIIFWIIAFVAKKQAKDDEIK